MHIPDGFLSTPVWGTLDVVSAPAVAWVARRAQRDTQDHRIPLLGVMGAFVFAAQMINFPVGPGTSGHLVGGELARDRRLALRDQRVADEHDAPGRQVRISRGRLRRLRAEPATGDDDGDPRREEPRREPGPGVPVPARVHPTARPPQLHCQLDRHHCTGY